LAFTGVVLAWRSGHLAPVHSIAGSRVGAA
jgi:hypothetical protein